MFAKKNDENETPLGKKKTTILISEPVAMTIVVFMCEKKNTMVIRAVKISCSRNNINMLLASREVRIGKNCAREQEQALGGTQDTGHSFSKHGPT